MKYFLILTLLSLNTFAEVQPLDLSSPRATFKTYLKAMVKVKNKENADENLKVARKTFDFSKSEMEPEFIPYALVRTLDRISKVDYNKIPTELNKDHWVYYQETVVDAGEKIFAEISMDKMNSEWKFSHKTVETISALYKKYKGREVVSGVAGFSVIRKNVSEMIPAKYKGKKFIFSSTDWAIILLIAFLGMILSIILRAITKSILKFKYKEMDDYSSLDTTKILKSFGRMIASVFWYNAVSVLNLSHKADNIVNNIIEICIIFYAAKTVYFINNIFSEHLRKMASKTDSKHDDIIVPIILKSLRVLIYIIAGFAMLQALGVDVTGLVAGLGIGGLAFALAAKDTLANLFGSMTLVFDQPFEIGDVITINNGTSGTVEAVGFRSTRIRTFEDSIVTIPNSNLMNSDINNLGKRRFRRLKTFLGVQYDTPPEKIEAFCEAVRKLIVSRPGTKKDGFHVYFNEFADCSLNIILVVNFETKDYSEDLAFRHRLLMDILRLANSMGIDFAFPTSTIHLFKEEKEEESVKDIRTYLEEFKNEAEKVTSNAISFEKPRSTADALDD